MVKRNVFAQSERVVHLNKKPLYHIRTPTVRPYNAFVNWTTVTSILFLTHSLLMLSEQKGFGRN